MKKRITIILLALFICVSMVNACSPADEPASGDTNSSDADGLGESTEEENNTDMAAPGNSYDGIKLDENGRLVPSAYDKMVTFETGKTPLSEIYIADNGSDTSGDGSEAAPYKTLTKAVAAATPGTAIRIKPGTYDTALYTNDLHGTEENPIWIGGIPGQERPVLTSEKGAITINRGSYIIIHDLEVTGSEIHGIHVNDGGDNNNFEAAHHFIFRNIYNHEIGDSCFKFAGLNYSWLFDCEVERSHIGGRESAAIDSVGCHYNTVAYNYIHDVLGIGVSFKGGSYEADIFANLFVNIGTSAVNMGQTTGDDFFRPSLKKDGTMYEAHDIRTYSNIFIGGESSFSFICATNCYAVNNTVIMPRSFLFRVLNTDEADSRKLANAGSPHDNTIANNIFYYGDSLRDPMNVGGKTSPATFVVQNNIFYFVNRPGNMPWNYERDFSQAINTLTSDPLFENIQDNNFALKADSPALSAGTDFPFAPEDYHGTPFPSPRSIGAVER